MAPLSLRHGCRALLNLSFLSLLCVFFLAVAPRLFRDPPSPIDLRIDPRRPIIAGDDHDDGCEGLRGLEDYRSKCSYLLQKQNLCATEAFIDYLAAFYCAFGGSPVAGYTVLSLWLLLLFYLLGNTASQYFCSSLEGLSKALRLSPSIAGVTLLSLGNGAPDVFSSVVSFAGSGGTGEVGLSGVLGGAFFVSTVVVGAVCLLGVDPHSNSPVRIERTGFIHDVFFFLAALAALLAILLVGKIGLLGSVGFFSLYLLYVLSVSATHLFREKQNKENGDLGEPLLGAIESQDPIICLDVKEEEEESAMEATESTISSSSSSSPSSLLSWLIFLLEIPLSLPRKLTIPSICKERWSKPYAVASVTLSPIFLATLWISLSSGSNGSSTTSLMAAGALVGLILGILAWRSTDSSSPPEKMILPWLVGGFVMSVMWAYITARELVSLLVSLGLILGIRSSIVGLTVLAWGNSIGDLTSNVAVAVHGGQDGAQIAVSGCYAGPIFNTLVGLGLSLVFSSWAARPAEFPVPEDPGVLIQTLGFSIAGLMWAFVVLPWRGMKLDRVLGLGLISIYLCFLFVRISSSLELDVVGIIKLLHLL